ncbi:hypothetical protein B2J93_2680 [Marssonina coronariae]|uniref:Uncharacterized protein n=1 Tax=Diplocarpon coronariae TaxID=2795749 RepID=A0A218Z9A4_9HELO|nr:hypothetical protein B2J93_2680 [Marssonina coronariae]
MSTPAEEHSKFALHEAAREGRTAVVESLLSVSIQSTIAWDEMSISGPQRIDDDSRLPIHWAVSYSHLEIVKLLAATKEFDPDVQDGSGWTPLMIAVSLKDGDELVDLLLRKEADVNTKNFTGQVHSPLPLILPTPKFQFPLHFLASKKNHTLAKRLLSHTPPASARVKDKRGQYALHRAAAVGSVPMVELLVQARSPVSAADSAGQTPLHHAIAEGHGDTAVALLKAGAEHDKKDAEGFLPLDLAPDSQVRKYILKAAEMEGIEVA